MEDKNFRFFSVKNKPCVECLLKVRGIYLISHTTFPFPGKLEKNDLKMVISGIYLSSVGIYNA